MAVELNLPVTARGAEKIRCSRCAVRVEAKQNRRLTSRLGWLFVLPLCALAASCGPAEWRTKKDAEPEPKAVEAAATPQPEAPSGPDLDQNASAPSLPAWAQAYIGKNPRTSFPRNGLCVGNTDVVQGRFGGASPGTSILGWGWDTHAKAHVTRVILVDINYQIVGAGEGGLPRGDVPQAKPDVTDPNTGWRAVTRLTTGPVEAYGVVDGGQAICPLGRLEF